MEFRGIVENPHSAMVCTYIIKSLYHCRRVAKFGRDFQFGIMNLYSLDKLAVFAVGLSKIFQYDHFPDIIAGFMVIFAETNQTIN